jgi:hypothetical protein
MIRSSRRCRSLGRLHASTTVAALARWLMPAASGVVTGLPLHEFYRQSPNVLLGHAQAVVTLAAPARSVAE